MGQEEAVPLPATVVVASWEQAEAVKPAAEDPDMPPESPKKAKAPGRRLSVPPPPGRPSMPGARSFSRGRAVRPEDDPFLAAYLACTRTGTGGGGGGGGGKRNGGGAAARPEPNKGQRRFTWAGLGLSCKGSGAVVELSMVKLAKRPETNPRDDA